MNTQPRTKETCTEYLTVHVGRAMNAHELATRKPPAHHRPAMKKAPKGPQVNKCAHSVANKPLNWENTCPRWDSHQPSPQRVHHSPENLRPSPTPIQPNPKPRVWTLSTPSFPSTAMHRPGSAEALVSREIRTAALHSFRATSRSLAILATAGRTASAKARRRGKAAGWETTGAQGLSTQKRGKLQGKVLETTEGGQKGLVLAAGTTQVANDLHYRIQPAGLRSWANRWIVRCSQERQFRVQLSSRTGHRRNILPPTCPCQWTHADHNGFAQRGPAYCGRRR
ncbi:hypothetical protein ABIE00_002578 [Arthrobacter sp. OAP107]